MSDQTYTNWREADIYTLKGLRVIDRAIAERLGYVVSEGDKPFAVRKIDQGGMCSTEHVPLPFFWKSEVYPLAFRPSLEESGFMLWLERFGETQKGVMAKKEPFEWYEYAIGTELPVGLPCCLAWLEWWDARHESELRKQAIREQVQPYQETVA